MERIEKDVGRETSSDAFVNNKTPSTKDGTVDPVFGNGSRQESKTNAIVLASNSTGVHLHFEEVGKDIECDMDTSGRRIGQCNRKEKQEDTNSAHTTTGNTRRNPASRQGKQRNIAGDSGGVQVGAEVGRHLSVVSSEYQRVVDQGQAYAQYQGGVGQGGRIDRTVLSFHGNEFRGGPKIMGLDKGAKRQELPILGEQHIGGERITGQEGEEHFEEGKSNIGAEKCSKGSTYANGVGGGFNSGPHAPLQTYNAVDVEPIFGQWDFECLGGNKDVESKRKDTATLFKRSHYRLRPQRGWKFKWPIHAKRVGKMEWEEVDQFVQRHGTEEEKTKWKYYAGFFHKENRYIHIDQRSAGWRPRITSLTCEDIHTLQEYGVIELAEERQIKNDVNSFVVAETSKLRKRFITETDIINDEFEIPEEMKLHLPGVEEVVQQMKKGPVASCVDFAAYYHQFPLDVELRNYFGFRTSDDNCFRLCTIPTGQRQCVGVAQLLSSIIARTAARGVCATTTFIDNLRFIGEVEEVNNCVDRLYNICSALKATLNESREEAEPESRYDFLGLSLDHGEQAVRLASKSIHKLQEAKTILYQHPTWQEVQSIFSLMIWAARVQQIHLAKFYLVIKFMRKRAAKGWKEEEEANIWPCSQPLFKEWLTCAIANKWRKLAQDEESNEILFTDASMEGYGAIAFVDGTTKIVAGKWPTWLKKIASIAELEARAFLIALNQIEFEGPIHARIDNTTVQQTYRKTHCRNYWINKVLGHIDQVVEKKQLRILSLEYVKSAENPADYYSRL